MTDDQIIGETIAIIARLSDLKEAVLHSTGAQAEFDGGMLAAALAVLESNLDPDDPRMESEFKRQAEARLSWVLSNPSPSPSEPDA